MKISTRGRYALRMMIDLAQHYDQGFIALKDISKTGYFKEISGADYPVPEQR